MMYRASSTAPIRASRPSARAFTLVELLIAMAAGLTVAMAAILLAKGATRFFQHEARASSAHMAALLGLNRLSADIQRAAFHSSPNVLKEAANNGICGDPTAWPEGMRRLAGISIKRQGSVADHVGELQQSIANGFGPDSIVIGGSLSTTEEFHYSSDPAPAAGGYLFILDSGSAAMKRTRERNAASGETYADIFRPHRLLRIRPSTQGGKSMYGVIKSVDVVGAAPNETVRVLVEPVPALPAFNGDCGLRTVGGSGGYVNPVSRVRYDLRSLQSDPKYGAVVAPINPSVTGDGGRTELVRVELDEQNAEMADTLELIAEYAVDLKFGLSVAAESGTVGTRNPTITRYPITSPDSTDVYNTAAEITDPSARPERIRSVQIRLSTRTRAPDRGADLGRRDDGRKLRFLLPGIVSGVSTDSDAIPAGAPDVFARMRTFYADVSLPNQAGVEW